MGGLKQGAAETATCPQACASRLTATAPPLASSQAKALANEEELGAERKKPLRIIRFVDLVHSHEVRDASVTCDFKDDKSSAYRKPGDTRTRGAIGNIFITHDGPGGASQPLRGLVNYPSYND